MFFFCSFLLFFAVFKARLGISDVIDDLNVVNSFLCSTKADFKLLQTTKPRILLYNISSKTGRRRLIFPLVLFGKLKFEFVFGKRKPSILEQVLIRSSLTK